MKCCAMRINTILNLVYFNVLGQVEDLKKDTESIKEGVNDIKEESRVLSGKFSYYIIASGSYQI